MNFDELFNYKIKEYLGIIRTFKKLSNYDYINLVTLVLTKGIISREDVSKEDINYFFNLIINKNNNIVNDNSKVYNEAVSYCVDDFFKKHGLNENSYLKIMNNWFNGYLFHTLNVALANEVNDYGLTHDCPLWNSSEIKEIISLLKKNVFGLFNGDTKGFFFASSLSSSPYYGLSSPTFFRKFIENDYKYLNVFLNRDLKKATESIEFLCAKNNLNPEEKEKVISFFKKYWAIFATNELPSIIMKPRENNYVIPHPIGDIKSFVTKQIIKDCRNVFLSNDISRDQLIIFSYETLEVSKQYQKTN